MKKKSIFISIITALILLTGIQSIYAHELPLSDSSEMYAIDPSLNINSRDGLDRMPPEAIDQVQEVVNYGFWFTAAIPRWQEFIPTLDNLSNVEIHIGKIGSPGDLIVGIWDETGTILIDEKTIPEASVISGWVNVSFFSSPFLELVPGEKYRINVASDNPIADLNNRYQWNGNTASTYCPKCVNDATSGWPDFDYAFRTHGFGVRRVTIADFNGDRSTDISVYRPSNGKWYIIGDSAVSWGLPGDIPVPGNYRDCGSNDIAVYRPSNGKWYVQGNSPLSWGFLDDIPVQADYDGDGDTDIAVLRPSNGKWYVQGIGNFSWYQSGDIPVPCDYDGDYIDEIAVYRPSNGKWYVMGESAVSWGFPGDIPVPGDYDGNGTCDIAVYRPSNGNWYIQGQGMTSWGFTGDIPVPGDYDGCGDTEIAVLRPSNGKWYVQGVGNFSWYASGDFPLPVRDTNADGDPYQ